MARTSAAKQSEPLNEKGLGYILDFQRHEWKYYVPAHMIEVIIPELLNMMKYDPYSDGDYYGIYSVYYDTEDWQAYYEKVDGIERRKKFRIRSYVQDPGPEDTVMLEIKEKNKDIILKRRTAIKFKHVASLNRGMPLAGADHVYDEWRYNIIRNGLKPRILVAYDRMAFVPKEHSDIRITLDCNVRHSFAKNLNGSFKNPVMPTTFARKDAVLEIKFKDHPPKFVIDLVKKYNLTNEAISKFCESVVTGYRAIL